MHVFKDSSTSLDLDQLVTGHHLIIDAMEDAEKHPGRHERLQNEVGNNITGDVQDVQLSEGEIWG